MIYRTLKINHNGAERYLNLDTITSVEVSEVVAGHRDVFIRETPGNLVFIKLTEADANKLRTFFGFHAIATVTHIDM